MWSSHGLGLAAASITFPEHSLVVTVSCSDIARATVLLTGGCALHPVLLCPDPGSCLLFPSGLPWTLALQGPWTPRVCSGSAL